MALTIDKKMTGIYENLAASDRATQGAVCIYIHQRRYCSLYLYMQLPVVATV